MPSAASLYDLTNSLQPVRRVWVQTTTQVLAGVGVSSSLATVVLHTARLGKDAQQKVLAHEIGVNAAALVRILDLGEEAELLVRRTTKADRRARFIDLLPKGKALADEIEQSLGDLRRELLGDLPEEDIRATTRVLRLLETRATDWLKSDRASLI